MAKRMGPKANSKLAKAPRAAPVEDAEERGLPDHDTVTAHIDALNALKAKGAKINGDIGELVKSAEERDNIHRGAMKLAAKLARMEDAARSEFLVHFDHYRDIMGLTVQPGLFDGDGAGAAAALN
ncbi:MAG TPA: hypothetical protein VG735_07890 [Caulobacterales bacterium]|nr:hypothetical protein [Caulobacterales bacterium]